MLCEVALGMILGMLSVPVVLNLLSPSQVMNTSFESLRIVNTYGAFGRYTLNNLVLVKISILKVVFDIY